MIKIYHLQKTTLQDFPKRIACIVFLLGCNFSCSFCHNPSAVKTKDGLLTEEEFFSFLDKRKGKLDGVVISGGEPTIYGDDLIKFIQKIKARDFLVKLDTNGSNPKILKELYKKNLLNYVAMDLKCPFEKYKHFTKTKNIISKIKQSIKIIMNSGIDYEFRTTAYPELTLDDFKKMFSCIKECRRYVIQEYVPDITLDSQKPLVVYGKETLNKIKKEIEEKEGIIYIR